MPVNLDIGNSMVRAYMQGMELAEGKKQRQFANKQREAEFAEEQKQNKERTRQFDDQLKHNRDVFLANQKMQQDKYDLDLAQTRRSIALAQAQGLPTGEIPTASATPDSREAFFDLNAAEGSNYQAPVRPSARVTNTADYGKTIGEISTPDPLSFALEQSQLTGIGANEKLKRDIQLELGKAGVKHKFDLELEEARQTGRESVAGIRVKGMKEAAAIRASRALKSKDPKDKLLTPDEQLRYNVTAGSTWKDVQGMTPGKILSAAEQEKSNGASEILQMLDAAEEHGKAAKWKGLGPIAGRVSRQATKFDALQRAVGSPEQVESEINFRWYIDNIKSTVGLLRAGKAFTANEERILDNFLPGLYKSEVEAKLAIKNLRQTIQNARLRMHQPDSMIRGGSNNPVGGGSKLPPKVASEVEAYERSMGLR